MKYTAFLFVFTSVALLFSPMVYAQFTIPGSASAVSVSLSPQYPAPNTTVVLTLESALYDLDTSDITWLENGTQVAAGNGLKTLTVQAGAVGSEVDVEADVAGGSGSASAIASIIPTSIDLLWESNSYVPPFYKGRALPSAGSSVRVVAIPHFSRPGLGIVPSGQIIYTWREDGAVLQSQSGIGKSSAIVDGPSLFGTETISVDAISSDGTISGEAVLRIPDTEPVLTLYEDQPLFGILYHQALGSTTFVPENEMSFAAIPYFVAESGPSAPGLQYDWTVNQTPVSVDPARANEITINAASSSGIALVALALTHATNYFLNAGGTWNITFNKDSTGGAPGNDPFQQ
jgi:hypothetical protein